MIVFSGICYLDLHDAETICFMSQFFINECRIGCLDIIEH